MNTETSQSNTVSAPGSNNPATQPLLWSVKRELWENRSIYMAPLIVAGLVLFGSAISAAWLPQRRHNALLLDPAHRQAAIETPYDMAAIMLIFTAFLVGFFYCLDALYGERRDRSVLFWKSLPVSDLTSVLSKAIIPLAVLPLVTFAIIVLTQLGMLFISTVALLPAGLSGTTFRNLPFFQMSVILLYGLITMVLWQAPMYAWLLLVSAWARRATFLCAVLPWIALCIVEKIAFDTAYIAGMLGRRIMGSFEDAFVAVKHSHSNGVPVVDQLGQLDPLRFLGTPGLWLGLIIAAVFLAGAVRLRRYRGPL